MTRAFGAIPSDTWRQLCRPAVTARRPRGLDAAWARAMALPARTAPRSVRLIARAAHVDRARAGLDDLSETELRERLNRSRSSIRLGRATSRDRETALALIAEAAHRHLGLRAHRVQLRGALALGEGAVIEMATGEGKTLVAALAAVLEGWRGRGCHVVTVNDYLARRDAEWMIPLYDFCGVRVASIEATTKPERRHDAYRADVTYATSKEFAADFLRDLLGDGQRGGGGQLARTLIRGADDRRAPLQRGLASAIVDEADSVLIDEAVTPLILSAATAGARDADRRRQADELARSLEMGEHFQVERARREISLTRAGCALVGRYEDGFDGVTPREREELITQALSALHLFEQGHHYVMEDDRVVIVDEFTGRLMPDRQWRGGLHQAIEAKECLEIHESSETLARISFQRFFGLYDQLCGMTGTAREARGEIWDVYRLPVIRIPTNRRLRRSRRRDRVLPSPEARWAAIVEETRRVRDQGRAVLIGTRSVAASEHLSTLLHRAGIEHQVLNAIRHEDEAQIVACAGETGRVTIATNMAGRGTDIKLGPGVAQLGGLHVIASERHESRRVDRQLFGRGGRQGDPGSGAAIVSLDDDLMRRHGRGLIVRLCRGAGARHTALRLAQWRAQRLARRQRASVMRDDDWLDDALGFAGAGARG